VLSARELSGFDLVEVDITLDPALHRDYGERIPVVEIDGREAFRYRVDRQRLIQLLPA
jgi:hypothetical protein